MHSFDYSAQFYLDRQNDIARRIRTGRETAVATGDEDQIALFRSIRLDLESYLTSRNQMLQRGKVTDLPAKSIMIANGHRRSVFLLRSRFFVGEYLYRPRENVVFGSVFKVKRLDP